MRWTLQRATVLASPRHRKMHLSDGGREVLAVVLRLAAVTALAGIGWIHLHLWQHGYRGLPTIGPLFLGGAAASGSLGAALLLWPSRFVAVAGAGTALGILAGLIVSVNVGLFGFRDSLAAPFAGASVVFEVAAALLLAAWTGLDLALESHPDHVPLAAPERRSAPGSSRAA